MSLARFRQLIHLKDSQVSSNQQQWFPRWIRSYCRFHQLDPDSDLIPLSLGQAIDFSRSLKINHTPAWQRLQAVLALDCYQRLMAQTTADLTEMKTVLRLAAAREKSGTAGDARIDPSEESLAPVLREMIVELRLQGYAYDTEKAYLGWVKRFIQFCGTEDLRSVPETQVRSFVSELAVKGNVAASTQKQALSALLFLYEKVFGKELGFLDIHRSEKAARLPVVFSQQEIARLIQFFSGRNRLMFDLMYGAGLRHKECRRLRIKDIEFDQHQSEKSAKGCRIVIADLC